MAPARRPRRAHRRRWRGASRDWSRLAVRAEDTQCALVALFARARKLQCACTVDADVRAGIRPTLLPVALDGERSAAAAARAVARLVGISGEVSRPAPLSPDVLRSTWEK